MPIKEDDRPSFRQRSWWPWWPVFTWTKCCACGKLWRRKWGFLYPHTAFIAKTGDTYAGSVTIGPCCATSVVEADAHLGHYESWREPGKNPREET